MYILRCYRDLVITPYEVDLGEYLAALKLGRKILEVRNRVLVGFRGVVELAEIATRVPGAVVFWYHVQGRRPCAFGTTDNSGVGHVVESRLGGGQLVRWEPSGLGKDSIIWKNTYMVELILYFFENDLTAINSRL